MAFEIRLFCEAGVPLRCADFWSSAHVKLGPNGIPGILKFCECSSYCPKEFGHLSSLESHVERLHTNESRHHCETCGRAFSSKSNHTAHKKIHTGVKPFACNFCPTIFEKKEVLELHIVVVHAGVNMNQENVPVTAKTVPSAVHVIAETVPDTMPTTEKSYYDCHICFDIFSDEDSLEKHVRSVHSADQEMVEEIFQLDDHVSYDFVFRQTQNQVGNEVFIFWIEKP